MKIFLSVFMLTAITHLNAYAQHFFGFKAGVTSSTKGALTVPINATIIVPKYNSFGMTYDYFFKKHLSFSGEINYSRRIVNVDHAYVSYSGLDLYWPPEHQKFTNNYISIPLKAGFRTGRRLFAFFNIGINTSILVRSSEVDNSSDVLYQKIFPNNYQRQLDFSALFDAGAGYKINEELLVFTSCNYLAGMTTSHIGNNSALSESFRISSTSFSAGLKFRFK